MKVIPATEPHHPPTVVPDRFWHGLDKLDPGEVLALYKEAGAILFRGFRVNQNNFRAFGDQFCTGFVRNRAQGRKNVSADARIQTVNIGGTLFPFHPEISREPWKPDVIFFACMSAPKNGGETQLADGTEMVKQMNPATRDMLLSRELLYRHPTSKESCGYWLEVENPTEADMERLADKKPFRFNITEKGDYVRSYIAPTLHKPMFTDDLAFGNHILFNRFRHNARNFPLLDDGSEIPEELCQEMNDLAYSVAYTHKWQKRDVLMVDNTRFMHGRPEFYEKGDRLILSQFGYLKAAPKDFGSHLGSQPWRSTPVWIEEEHS